MDQIHLPCFSSGYTCQQGDDLPMKSNFLSWYDEDDAPIFWSIPVLKRNLAILNVSPSCLLDCNTAIYYNISLLWIPPEPWSHNFQLLCFLEVDSASSALGKYRHRFISMGPFLLPEFIHGPTPPFLNYCTVDCFWWAKNYYPHYHNYHLKWMRNEDGEGGQGGQSLGFHHLSHVHEPLASYTPLLTHTGITPAWFLEATRFSQHQPPR